MAIKMGALMLFTMFGLPNGMDIAAPGIEGVFTITAEQKEKLAAVQREVMGADEVRAAEKTVASKDASDEQKKAARKTIRDAEAKLREKAAPLLTAEQKELVKKLKTAFVEVAKGLLAEYKDKLAAAKDDEAKNLRREMTEKGKAELAKKLDGILSDEQKAAMGKAAKAKKRGQKRMLRLRQLQQVTKSGGRRGRR